MKDDKKIKFLKSREHQISFAVTLIALVVEYFVDNEMYATELSDFTSRLEACLREIKAIRSAIGDKADELGGAS